ncbi:beta-eliminating lyase-related protein, partial [Eggerthella lenta]|uniref:beta-eliminating lyase-related protein n=1 Tax=Eggerthella lenta TaxID=84112 RepID=UPI001D08F7C2
SGGTCVPLERMKAIRELAQEFGVPVHMDGARMFNAVVALGVEAREMCKYVDSVMFCILQGSPAQNYMITFHVAMIPLL